MKHKCTTWDKVAMTILVIGGLNWGLVGALEYDLVAELLGAMSDAARVVYVLVGLSAIYMLVKVLSCKK